jgi:hypothetical protein
MYKAGMISGRRISINNSNSIHQHYNPYQSLIQYAAHQLPRRGPDHIQVSTVCIEQTCIRYLLFLAASSPLSQQPTLMSPPMSMPLTHHEATGRHLHHHKVMDTTETGLWIPASAEISVAGSASAEAMLNNVTGITRTSTANFIAATRLRESSASARNASATIEGTATAASEKNARDVNERNVSDVKEKSESDVNVSTAETEAVDTRLKVFVHS